MALPASLAPVLRLPLPSLHCWKPRHAKHDGSLQVQVPPCCPQLVKQLCPVCCLDVQGSWTTSCGVPAWCLTSAQEYVADIEACAAAASGEHVRACLGVCHGDVTATMMLIDHAWYQRAH